MRAGLSVLLSGVAVWCRWHLLLILWIDLHVALLILRRHCGNVRNSVATVSQKNQKRASNKGAYFSVAFSKSCALGCVEFVVCESHCNALIHFLVFCHKINSYQIPVKKLNKKDMHESLSFMVSFTFTLCA